MLPFHPWFKASLKLRGIGLLVFIAAAGVWSSCTRNSDANTTAAAPESAAAPRVAVARVGRKTMARYLTVSSELVPFQEIDVFAKESGFVKQLYVDYGSHVKTGQLLAVLEIPELQALLQEDQASIKSFSSQVINSQHELGRIEAQHKVLHLQYDRLNSVALSKPGLVAQQEVDDSQGKDLAAEAQVESARSRLQVAQSQLTMAQSKLTHDQALYNYSKITAPFAGVVTQRYANLGTLMQAGTNSSTQALPLVKLAQEDRFRLTIPVPESYVRYIRVGDPVKVQVPSLGREFPGKVARFSHDVTDTTRTMHTEVDVLNPTGVLVPGLYTEATLTLDRQGDALVVPLQAVTPTETNRGSVLVVNEANQLQSREITTGIQTENDTEVVAGLKEGDRVVTSDRSGLHAGDQVEPVLKPAASYKGQG